MKSINFLLFPIPDDISHQKWTEVDVREDIANLIYLHIGGIRAHDLAFKIFRSQNDITLDDEDLKIVRQVIEVYGMPRLIDGLNKILG